MWRSRRYEEKPDEFGQVGDIQSSIQINVSFFKARNWRIVDEEYVNQVRKICNIERSDVVDIADLSDAAGTAGE